MRIKIVIEREDGFKLIDRITDNVPQIDDYEGRTLITTLEPRTLGINNYDMYLWIEVRNNTVITESSGLNTIGLRSPLFGGECRPDLY